MWFLDAKDPRWIVVNFGVASNQHTHMELLLDEEHSVQSCAIYKWM